MDGRRRPPLPSGDGSFERAILIGFVPSSLSSMLPAASDGVELTTAVADDLPLIEVDPLRIREVLTNLVSNAVRHAGRPGSVRVVATAGAGWVEMGVVDSGPGIDPEQLLRTYLDRLTMYVGCDVADKTFTLMVLDVDGVAATQEVVVAP